MRISTGVDPVLARSPIKLQVDPKLRGRLAGLAVGRPLLIDYYASRLRGIAAGDLIVRFGDPPAEPCYVELEAIEHVLVLAERHLLAILEGARLQEAGPPWHRHLAIAIARPEDWIDFLDRHPSRRR